MALAPESLSESESVCSTCCCYYCSDSRPRQVEAQTFEFLKSLPLIPSRTNGPWPWMLYCIPIAIANKMEFTAPTCTCTCTRHTKSLLASASASCLCLFVSMYVTCIHIGEQASKLKPHCLLATAVFWLPHKLSHLILSHLLSPQPMAATTDRPGRWELIHSLTHISITVSPQHITSCHGLVMMTTQDL